MQATMVVVWHGTNDQYHTIAFGTFGATISNGSSWSDRLPKRKVMVVVWYHTKVIMSTIITSCVPPFTFCFGLAKCSRWL